MSMDAVGSLEPSPATKCRPNNHAHNDVIPKLAMELTRVIVTERFTSPPNIAVQKFEGAPPGLAPSNISPSCS